jgi:SAM-dependent methyltransferase
MHDTAFRYGQLFYDIYVPKHKHVDLVELGSQNVNGTLRDAFTGANIRYIGVDFEPGVGVDIVLEDPYKLPIEDNQADIVLCSSVLEHSELFWVSFLEMVRILKPGGLLYINVPSNGNFHRHPVDCWRLYPDSGRALQKWAQLNNHNILLLESFTGLQHGGIWNDFVGVFLKENTSEPYYLNTYNQRIVNHISDYTNAFVYGSDEIHNYSLDPEDMRLRYA